MGEIILGRFKETALLSANRTVICPERLDAGAAQCVAAGTDKGVPSFSVDHTTNRAGWRLFRRLFFFRFDGNHGNNC